MLEGNGALGSCIRGLLTCTCKSTVTPPRVKDIFLASLYILDSNLFTLCIWMLRLGSQLTLLAVATFLVIKTICEPLSNNTSSSLMLFIIAGTTLRWAIFGATLFSFSPSSSIANTWQLRSSGLNFSRNYKTGSATVYTLVCHKLHLAIFPPILQ